MTACLDRDVWTLMPRTESTGHMYMAACEVWLGMAVCIQS